MDNRANNVFDSKMAAKQDIAAMLLPTLGATILYFLPVVLLSIGFSAVCGTFDPTVLENLTAVQVLLYTGIYLLAKLLITQPLYYGLTQFYALRRGGARPSVTTVTMCFSSIQLYGVAIRMTLIIALFTLLWSIPAIGLCAAAYGIYHFLPGTMGWFVAYELLIVTGLLFLCTISRYHCAYALLIEQPSLGCWKAVRKAAQQFRGHKRDVLSLILSFFHWFFLAVLTNGFLLILVYPYYLLSLYHLFDRIRGVKIKVQTQPESKEK